MKRERAIIFLNGILPVKKVLDFYIKKSDLIVCADGGANNIKKYGLYPHIIIGDMDSFNPRLKNVFLKSGTIFIQVFEQETTDFEKAINYITENCINTILVFGVSSMRLDHTFNNISVLKRFSSELNIIFIDNDFEISFINKYIKFKYKKGELISLLPLGKNRNVNTIGLKYPLKNEKLEFGVREGTLNSSSSNRISISYSGDSLLLFKKHFII